MLCSHCLFTYTEQLDYAFHLAAIREMLRVGREVRVFPLLDMNAEVSEHLAGVEGELRDDGYTVERVKVDYEFQIGGNEMIMLSLQ